MKNRIIKAIILLILIAIFATSSLAETTDYTKIDEDNYTFDTGFNMNFEQIL